MELESKYLYFSGVKRGRKPKGWVPDDRTPKRVKLNGTASDGVAKISLAAEHVFVREPDIRKLATGKRSTLKSKGAARLC